MLTDKKTSTKSKEGTDLQIVILTDLRPSKVDLHDLTCAIEHLIEERFESVCRDIKFSEVPRAS